MAAIKPGLLESKTEKPQVSSLKEDDSDELMSTNSFPVDRMAIFGFRWTRT